MNLCIWRSHCPAGKYPCNVGLRAAGFGTASHSNSHFHGVLSIRIEDPLALLPACRAEVIGEHRDIRAARPQSRATSSVARALTNNSRAVGGFVTR